jgi:ubiquinone/menaquinone biosynthesis C-methylase UbiE
MAIEKDQKKFFDQYAAGYEKKAPVNTFFFDLAIGELRRGFLWLSDCRSLLEYGCGTGESIELFLEVTGKRPDRIVGIDLSDVSVDVARRRHPFEFHVVPDNDLTFLPEASLEGAYMIGVLHHTEEHQKIFDQVARVLQPGGKFFVLDLTRNNPIIESARAVFPFMPKRVKGMFPDDLVVDETIPEKLSVEVDGTVARLQQAGFVVEYVEFGHLAYFVFDWIERLTRLQLSRTRLNVAYSAFYRFEKWLLTMGPFKRRAHLFALRAVKHAAAG